MSTVRNLEVQIVIEKNVEQNMKKLKQAVEKAIKTMGNDVKLVEMKSWIGYKVWSECRSAAQSEEIFGDSIWETKTAARSVSDDWQNDGTNNKR